METAKRHPRHVLFGGLIIAGLAALAALVFALADIRQAFNRTYTVVALFPKADGLREDSPVWIAGRVVGRVTEIVLLPVHYDTIQMVAVTIELPRRVQAQVRRDSYARLTATTLIGERVVDIAPGSPAMPPLTEADTMDSRIPREFAELRERTAEFRIALDSLSQAMAAVRAPLGARMRALEPVRREIELTRREFVRLQRAYEDGPAYRALRDTETRAALERLSDRLAEIGPAFARAAGTAEGVGQPLRDAVAALLHSFEMLSADITALAARIEDTDGFVGRSARDTAIQVAVRGTQEELDSLVAAVRRNPFRFFRLRLF